MGVFSRYVLTAPHKCLYSITQVPTSPTLAPAEATEKPQKTSLDKELERLASLKKHPPPRAVSVQEFENTYGLPKEGKNLHKLKIPSDLTETDLIQVFLPTKGRKKKAGYTYSECNDVEVVARIFQIFPVVYLRDLPKSKIIAKQFARGIVMEKRKKKQVSWAKFVGTSNHNQRSKWLKKVETCLAVISRITGSNDKDLYKAEGIDDLLHDLFAELRKVP